MSSLQRYLHIFALVGGLAPGSAQALPDYPDYLQSAAVTPCLPHCNVCHRDDNAGSGTIDRPFGISMRRVGHLGSGGKSDVTRAVADLRNAATDSDGDGVPDIEELSLGDDPNWAGRGSICGPEVGCVAARSGRARPSGTALAFFLLAAAALRRRHSMLRLRA